MKTIFYLILTSLISTGAFMAGLNQQNCLQCFGIALAAWVFVGDGTAVAKSGYKY